MQVSTAKIDGESALKRYFINPVISYIKENLGILIGLIVMCIVLSIMSPAFLTKSNVLNILRQVSTNANLAFGMTLAIIICGIDLSVGSILALAGTLTAGLITVNHMPSVLAILIGLVVGTLLGLFNGVVIAKTGIPPFIVTLAMYNIARGAAYVYTGGNPIRTIDPVFNFIGNGYLGPVPLPVIYTVIFFIAVSYMMNRTQFGRHIYALGGNKEAAKFSGININKVQIGVYTLLGFLASFSGIVLCGRMYSGQPTVGVGFELDAIAAVVLGGTSMMGGIGKMGGTVLGVLVIGVLNNGLNLLNINSFWQLIAKGIVILLAVYVDILKKKKR
ncbi:ribose ABC transporter permease [Clostridium sp. SYSU_GA19001]|uniref:ABC transporter permease n=1 Tax=Clostridium caldaquaticum TaxID=2940653 RepID=UPI0020773C48|nr:ribose ABC transporter permease [Clostridium caldaquaticum]MCM8712088.1 ribose ABC transporter permease [Clostridium caldaquaticum]